MKIHVDMNKCICAGMCINIAPRLFDLDDAGRLVVLKETELASDEVSDAESAAACCPAEAIALLSLETVST